MLASSMMNMVMCKSDNAHIFYKQSSSVKLRTRMTMADSSRAAPMSEGGEDPQPNSDIHSRFPVGFTSLRICARCVPRYCGAQHSSLNTLDSPPHTAHCTAVSFFLQIALVQDLLAQIAIQLQQ